MTDEPVMNDVPVTETKKKDKRSILHHAKRISSWIWGNLSFIFFLILVFILCSRILALSITYGDSMQPNISGLMIGNRLAYEVRDPKRGDVVLFRQGGDVLVKRVIGLPGESISINGGAVLVNGQILDEPYLPEGTLTDPGYIYGVVPDGMYFLLGDNRDDSYDSRFFPDPFVSRYSFIARVFYVFDGIPGHMLYQYSTSSDNSTQKYPADESISVLP